MRRAIRAERKVAIALADSAGRESERVIWPFALAFFEAVRVVVAWCELRRDYRAFRADRILRMEVSGTRYPRRRHRLMQEWKATGSGPQGVQAADGN